MLAAEKLLKVLGLDSGVFDARFLKQLHSLKCDDLRRAGFPSHDFVGTAARSVEGTIEK